MPFVPPCFVPTVLHCCSLTLCMTLIYCTLIFGTEPLPDMVGCYISLPRACGGHTVSISRVLLFSGTDQSKTGVASWLKVRPHNSNGGRAKRWPAGQIAVEFSQKGPKRGWILKQFCCPYFSLKHAMKNWTFWKDFDTDRCWKNWCRFVEPREKFYF